MVLQQLFRSKCSAPPPLSVLLGWLPPTHRHGSLALEGRISGGAAALRSVPPAAVRYISSRDSSAMAHLSLSLNISTCHCHLNFSIWSSFLSTKLHVLLVILRSLSILICPSLHKIGFYIYIICQIIEHI